MYYKDKWVNVVMIREVVKVTQSIFECAERRGGAIPYDEGLDMGLRSYGLYRSNYGIGNIGYLLGLKLLGAPKFLIEKYRRMAFKNIPSTPQLGGKGRKVLREILEKHGGSVSYNIGYGDGMVVAIHEDGRIRACYEPASGYNPNPWKQSVPWEEVIRRF